MAAQRRRKKQRATPNRSAQQQQPQQQSARRPPLASDRLTSRTFSFRLAVCVLVASFPSFPPLLCRSRPSHGASASAGLLGFIPGRRGHCFLLQLNKTDKKKNPEQIVEKRDGAHSDACVLFFCFFFFASRCVGCVEFVATA